MVYTKKLIIVFIVLAVLLTACGSQTAGNNSAQAGSATDGSAPGLAGDTPDLYGEVKSISGNEVTLAVIEMPQRFNFQPGSNQPGGNNGNGFQRGQDQGDGQGSQNRQGPGSNRSSDNGQSSGNGQGSDNNGGQSNGQAPDNGQNGNGPGQGNRPGRGNGNGGFGMQRNYTGETLTLSIPSDTPITTFARSGQDRSEKKLAFSDIKVGSLLQVYYKDGTKDVESITLIQIPTGNGQGNGAAQDSSTQDGSAT